MKLRIYKAQMHKALLWYTERLTEKHIGCLLTPARIEQLKWDLRALQERMKKTETNPVWTVPVVLHVEPGRGHFEVVIADDSNILYLDPE